MTRRAFLDGLLASGACAGCRAIGIPGGPRFGAQLFSVRDVLMREGPAKTFAALGEFGYAGVELYSGALSCAPAEMARLLDGAGLVACGVHIGPDDLETSRLDRILDDGLAFGNTHFVDAWSVIRGKTPAEQEEDWKRFADRLGAAAEYAAARGCTIGYHNHRKEFVRAFGGRCAWEIVYDRASPLLKTEMDVGWATDAGEDVAAWFARYPGRALSLHAKEVSPGRALGDVPSGARGVDWSAVGRAAVADCTQWIVVECEAEPGNPGLLRDSLSFIREGGYFE